MRPISRPALLRRAALCSASPRIASRLRQFRALLCFSAHRFAPAAALRSVPLRRTSLRACGSKPPERYAPSGLSLPLRFARGPLPRTEPRAATPSGGLPPSGALAHKAAQLHLFVRKTCPFTRKAARFHFFAGESSPFARKAARFHFFVGETCSFACNASRTLLPDQPVSPSLCHLACNVS